MKAMMSSSRDNETGDNCDGRTIEIGIWDSSNVHPVKFFHIVLRPHLRTHEAQAHLDQTMVEVDEHHFVTVLGYGVIEGYRAKLLGVWVTQTFHTARPGPGQSRHFEDGAIRCTFDLDGFQRWLFCESETGLDCFTNTIRRQMEIFLSFLKSFVKSRDPLL